jgi:hypothetical protein
VPRGQIDEKARGFASDYFFELETEIIDVRLVAELSAVMNKAEGFAYK